MDVEYDGVAAIVARMHGMVLVKMLQSTILRKVTVKFC